MLRATVFFFAVNTITACPGGTTRLDAGLSQIGFDGGLMHRSNLAHNHVASCEDLSCGEDANPPLGGPHCATWLPCRVFDAGVNRCNWVHNLEHGHAVLAYNCPAGCPEIAAALTAIWRGARESGNARVLVTPDPKLATKVAAIVWGWGWVGESVDGDAIALVLSHQDEEAPESGLSCAP